MHRHICDLSTVWAFMFLSNRADPMCHRETRSVCFIYVSTMILFFEKIKHLQSHFLSLAVYVSKQTNCCASACACVVFADSDRWRNALTVELRQASNGSWHVSTLELQLASVEICVVCRGVCNSRVDVTERMPLNLWGDKVSLSTPRTAVNECLTLGRLI